MNPTAIVSYDDSHNDHDALALGRLLRAAGAELELAYVRHTTDLDPARERQAAADAAALLDRGARWLDDPAVPRHVVISGSTGEGLGRLALEREAGIVIFGSDYRTSPGHVQPGRSAQRLLDGGPVAVALAPANFRGRRDAMVTRIGVLATGGDSAAQATAQELATALGADVVPATTPVDLLVVGSRAEAPHGRVMVTAQGNYAIETARAPVLVVPHGVPVRVRDRIPAGV